LLSGELLGFIAAGWPRPALVDNLRLGAAAPV